jgi:hypothetical protein
MTSEDLEELEALSIVALDYVIKGRSQRSRMILKRMSTWELGQLEANLDRLSQLVREEIERRT